MLEKFVEAVMMDDFYHNRHFSILEKYAQEKCMLTKGLVIGLLLGIDCLTDNPYKNDHSL